jgi:cysteinyl-tRNA synthetase, unknown class
MKRLYIILMVGFLLAACSKNDIPDLDFQQEMRVFVTNIANYARAQKPGFIVVPQNGEALITLDGEPYGPVASNYVAIIDGQAREDLFYGYDGFGIPTPVGEQEWMMGFLNVAMANNKTILVTDYCMDVYKVNQSYALNDTAGYISFAANSLELDLIPEYIYHENEKDIYCLEEIENFLYLINPVRFATREEYIDSLQSTNYDLLILDLDFDGINQLSASEVTALKMKSNGAKRLVLCYMSIGEAENYRYYWQPGWEIGNPVWLEEENADWPGNWLVRYWDPEWQSIIYGNANSYIQMILNAGFDGVYLDKIDAYEAYE